MLFLSHARDAFIELLEGCTGSIVSILLQVEAVLSQIHMQCRACTSTVHHQVIEISLLYGVLNWGEACLPAA